MKILSNILFIIHLILLLLVIFIPLFGSRKMLLLYIVFMPLIVLQWIIIDGCWITKLQNKIDGDKIPFTSKLLRPIYDLENDKYKNEKTRLIVAILYVYVLYRFINMKKSKK